ncbi:glycosyltransferase family 2 protein [Flaviaesturariibacter amylovorans]|uniref:Glycosyltransferase family 2 protein n=1 Tax=Flaviaesturariibacter amylovorans TaxID=1084520 RepID=A0ABP8HEK8_9BACT
MAPISVVIITHNEAANLGACLASARRLSSDIVVVDCGSDDGTAALAQVLGATVLHLPWRGYGAARNAGAAAAKHHWVLALDADERLSEELVAALAALPLHDPSVAYRFRRRNHFKGRAIRFGTFGFDAVTRLYHRGVVRWNDYPVHELPEGHTRVQHIAGDLLHYGITDTALFRRKKDHYALLCARRYHDAGLPAGPLQLLAPLFNSVKSYLFLGGFLDGYCGLFLARSIYRYTRLKYRHLARLRRDEARSAPQSFPARSGLFS